MCLEVGFVYKLFTTNVKTEYVKYEAFMRWRPKPIFFFISFQEIVFPIYFVAILAVIRLTTPEELPPVNGYPREKLDKVTQLLQGSLLLVSPSSSVVDTFLNDLVLRVLPQYNLQYEMHDTMLEAEEKYTMAARNDSEMVSKWIGLHFEDPDLANFSYMLRFGKTIPAYTEGSVFGSQG